MLEFCFVFIISKNKKNLLQFTFEKITCCAKREKIQAVPPPPPDIKWSITNRCHLLVYCIKLMSKNAKIDPNQTCYQYSPVEVRKHWEFNVLTPINVLTSM